MCERRAGLVALLKKGAAMPPSFTGQLLVHPSGQFLRLKQCVTPYLFAIFAVDSKAPGQAPLGHSSSGQKIARRVA